MWKKLAVPAACLLALSAAESAWAACSYSVKTVTDQDAYSSDWSGTEELADCSFYFEGTDDTNAQDYTMRRSSTRPRPRRFLRGNNGWISFQSFADRSVSLIEGAPLGEWQGAYKIHRASSSDWAGRYPLYLLTRPSGKDSRASILVESYASGNRLYPTAARYLAAMDDAPRAERPVSRGTRRVAGEKLTLWERAYSEPERIRADGAAESLPIRERFVVLEEDGGFLVARLKAAQAEFEERSVEFDAFLASFEAR